MDSPSHVYSWKNFNKPYHSGSGARGSHSAGDRIIFGASLSRQNYDTAIIEEFSGMIQSFHQYDSSSVGAIEAEFITGNRKPTS
jgi:hypothetical protein